MKFRRMITDLFAALVIATLLLNVTLLAQEPIVLNEIIVRVNNDIITLAAYERNKQELENELKQKNLPPDQHQQELAKATENLLQNMIDERLLVQKARELDIDVEAELNQQWINYAKQFGFDNLREFEAALQKTGINPDSARDSLKVRLLRDSVMRAEVFGPVYRRITEPEARDFYNQHVAEFSIPAEVSLSEIFVGLTGRSSAEAESLAKQALAEARRGGDFKALVKKYSDPTRASYKNQGVLGTVKVDDLDETIKPAIAKLNAGDLTEPILSQKQGGFIVYRADAVKPAIARPFEEVKEQIYNFLAYQKGSKNIEEYIKKLRQRAYIDVKNGYEHLLISS